MIQTIIEQANKVIVELHEALRISKIKEKSKPIFTASLLVALKDTQSRQEPLLTEDFKSLGEQCISTIKDILLRNNIPEMYARDFVESFEQSLKAINLKKTKLDQEYSLRWYINELETKLLPLTTESVDILSIIYHQFIKYSAGDGSSLGIVLTPDHIAEFMADVIDIKERDNVIDMCCGSGTFLIEAAKRNKTGVICGIEHDTENHLLSIANAILQESTNMNVFNANCYDEKVKESLQSVGFNKALLNPPFSQKDHDEIEFMINVLDFMVEGGELAVICPVSCAIGQKFKSSRKEIMLRHTLKAVFTMPDELFRTNGASTYSCVMVWKAHQPHNANIPTFFGSFKDDGFEKKKKVGRVDNNHRWNNIKNTWIDAYVNKSEIREFATNHCVGVEDEWLCEAYMELDYSKLTDDDFQKVVNDYAAFMVGEGLIYEE